MGVCQSVSPLHKAKFSDQKIPSAAYLPDRGVSIFSFIISTEFSRPTEFDALKPTRSRLRNERRLKQNDEVALSPNYRGSATED
jgi:hypothetical protein